MLLYHQETATNPKKSYCANSVVLGGELVVRNKIETLRRFGHYLRRKNLLAVEHGALFRLREQRGEFVFR